jgi:hypothetical protein
MKVYHYLHIPGAEHTAPKRAVYEVAPETTLENLWNELKAWPGIKLVMIPGSKSWTSLSSGGLLRNITHKVLFPFGKRNFVNVFKTLNSGIF